MIKKSVMSPVIFVLFLVSFNALPCFAFDVPFYVENFEGTQNCSADNGVWEVGSENCHEGNKCAGTILKSNYPPYTDSRLICPMLNPWDDGVVLPEVNGAEEIHIRFWQSFSYSSHDTGQVQVQVHDSATGGWGSWQNVGSSISAYSGSGWFRKDIDITSYAGETIRIGFSHVADRNCSSCASESSGWFIDNIQFIKKVPVFTGDFEPDPSNPLDENGWGDWSADHGIWQIGELSTCHGGTQCAGTILDGNYPAWNDSRLESATVTLNGINGAEELHLRFWQWFNYSSHDSGQVQVQVYDNATGGWGSWQNVGSSISAYSGSGWSRKDIDLTSYSGETIRIGFLHVADRNCSSCASEGSGWFIDDVQFVKKSFVFTGDFESGWEDWSANRGVWQIGKPSSGPGQCYEGEQCAGTILDGNYPAWNDSRLESSLIDLTACSTDQIYLRFREWFSFSSYDYGEIQISVFDDILGQWSTWTPLGKSSGVSPVWTDKFVSLSAYAGRIFRIGFFHVADRNCSSCASESSGWYIDNIELVGPTRISPTITNISYTPYIPQSSCRSFIDIVATDACVDGDLTYHWYVPDGGILIGTGSKVEFIPHETRTAPHKVHVFVSSNVTKTSSFVNTVKVYTEVLFDLDLDKDIDGGDLREYIVSGEINALGTSRFAEEFGMVACEEK